MIQAVCTCVDVLRFACVTGARACVSLSCWVRVLVRVSNSSMFTPAVRLDSLGAASWMTSLGDCLFDER